MQNSSIMIQYGYENSIAIEWLWSQAALGLGLFLGRQLNSFPPWSALLCSLPVCFVLCLSAMFMVCFILLHFTLVRHLHFQLIQEDAVFLPLWEEKVHSMSQSRPDLCGQKSSPLVPDWSILTQMRTLNSHCLVQKHCPFWSE